MIKLDKATVLQSLANLEQPRLVLTPEDAPMPNAIPASWWPLLSLDGVNSQQLTELWGPLPAVLPETWAQLTRTLRGLAVLLEEGHPPTLLYLYTGQGRLFHHRGQPPISRGHVPERLRDVWASWPTTARDLYEVHNGWSLLFSLSMGHLPIAEIEMADSPDVGLDVDGQELPLDLRRTALVYSNGAGNYLCLESPASAAATARAFVWSPAAPEQIGLEAGFAAIYDAWTAIHFESMDSAE
jgi:hypothetical protein